MNAPAAATRNRLQAIFHYFTPQTRVIAGRALEAAFIGLCFSVLQEMSTTNRITINISKVFLSGTAAVIAGVAVGKISRLDPLTFLSSAGLSFWIGHK